MSGCLLSITPANPQISPKFLNKIVYFSCPRSWRGPRCRSFKPSAKCSRSFYPGASCYPLWKSPSSSWTIKARNFLKQNWMDKISKNYTHFLVSRGEWSRKCKKIFCRTGLNRILKYNKTGGRIPYFFSYHKIDYCRIYSVLRNPLP